LELHFVDMGIFCWMKFWLTAWDSVIYCFCKNC
jgi:hypothetical protein